MRIFFLLIISLPALCASLLFSAASAAETRTGEHKSGEYKNDAQVSDDIPRLAAREIGRWPAAEALQGAAVDDEHFYAVVNYAIGKYRKKDGAKVTGWRGERGGAFRHLNSCYAAAGELVCAHSNFPELPMASSLEIFDARDLAHKSSRALGFSLGSLTWAERRKTDQGGEEWWAGFAHYDGKGGEPGRPHTYASVARFDAEWRLLEQWLLPASVLAPMAPHAASGGSFGPDGLIYLTGHDRREIYVVAPPRAGVRLEHLATIEINAEGQAFAWDRSQADKRILYAISRPSREVRAFEIPSLPRRDE